jgi:YebC/PmpR family DNA-binding regulatory protein
MGRAFEYRKARKLKRWGNMARTFTRIGKEIDIAVKAGGADPANNTRLRILVQNAKAANMPKENVERAIKRAVSKDTSDYKEIVYEGYAPHGVAIVVETATDNNTRTVANVRHAFSKYGGSLGTSGSLDFLFERKCIFKINKPATFDVEEFELEMIDYGADEVFEDEDGVVNIYGSFEAYGNIQKFLEEGKFDIVSGEFERIPTDTKELTDEQRADVDKILDKLDEDDDVTNVYHNIKE